MRTHHSCAATATVLSIAVLAGCSDSPNPSSSSAPTTPPPVLTTVTASQPASTSPAPRPRTERSRCQTAQLSGSAHPSDNAAAGSFAVTLGLTNTSSSTCDLRGYPGVSFVGDDDGTQIGAPARRDKQFAPVVRVSPGETADVMVRISQAGNYDSSVCDPASVDGFRVYPPNDTAALFIRYTAATGCRSSRVALLTTGPVTK